MDRVTQYVPHWLAWPLNLLSAAAALAGAWLVFWGAAFGDGSLNAFSWAGGCFAGSAVLWWIADIAAANRPV